MWDSRKGQVLMPMVGVWDSRKGQASRIFSFWSVEHMKCISFAVWQLESGLELVPKPSNPQKCPSEDMVHLLPETLPYPSWEVLLDEG